MTKYILQAGTIGTPGTSGTTSVARPRIKRVNLKDMLFYLEQERESCRSNMLYKAYLKWSILEILILKNKSNKIIRYGLIIIYYFLLHMWTHFLIIYFVII